MSFPYINAYQQFFDSSGDPLVSGTIEFRDPTTNSLINTYPTADDADAQTNANANPLTLSATGAASAGLFLEDGVAYKVILKDAAGNIVATHDDVRCSIALPYLTTAAETAAAVTVVNIEYPPGNVLRYGTNTTPGTTDMTAAVQAALTVDQDRVWADSRDVMLITTELTSSIADRVIEGLSLTTDGSILAADYLLACSGARTKIVGCTFDGIATTTACSALQITGVDSVVTENYFTDFDNGAGIAGDSAADGSVISNNYLDNCAFVSAGSQYGSINCNADNALITGNRITDCGQTGISMSGNDYTTISDNYIEGKTTGTTSGGIILDGNNVGCVITGNTVNGCKVEGILISGSLALYTTASSEHVVSNNILLDCGYSGISIDGADADSVNHIAITGNTIKYTTATARAIQLQRASYINISGNYIYGYNIGINIPQLSPNINVTGNTFEAQDTTTIQVYGQYWLVSGNRIIGDGAAGSTTGIIFNAPSNKGDQLIVGNQIRDCLVGINGTFSGSERTFVQNNHLINNGTDLSYTSNNTNSSTNNVPDGSAIAGTFTLDGASPSTVTVSNASLEADDRIVMSLKTVGGTPDSVPYISARTNGASFVVKAGNGDTSVYYYEFVR